MTKTLRSLLHEKFPMELRFKFELLSRNRTLSNREKQEEVFNLLREFDVENVVPLGPGTNRYAFKVDGFVIKIATDNEGRIDNLKEFKMSKRLYPYVIIVHEVSENGTMLVCEYVQPFLSYSEMLQYKNPIIDILEELSSAYLIGDVGVNEKNFTNWGIRIGTSCPVCLDFAYVYEVSSSLFVCSSCGGNGIIVPNQTFSGLHCNNSVCGVKYKFEDLRRKLGNKAHMESLNDVGEEGYILTQSHTDTVIDIEKSSYLKLEKTSKNKIKDVDIPLLDEYPEEEINMNKFINARASAVGDTKNTTTKIVKAKASINRSEAIASISGMDANTIMQTACDIALILDNSLQSNGLYEQLNVDMTEEEFYDQIQELVCDAICNMCCVNDGDIDIAKYQSIKGNDKITMKEVIEFISDINKHEFYTSLLIHEVLQDADVEFPIELMDELTELLIAQFNESDLNIIVKSIVNAINDIDEDDEYYAINEDDIIEVDNAESILELIEEGVDSSEEIFEIDLVFQQRNQSQIVTITNEASNIAHEFYLQDINTIPTIDGYVFDPLKHIEPTSILKIPVGEELGIDNNISEQIKNSPTEQFSINGPVRVLLHSTDSYNYIGVYHFSDSCVTIHAMNEAHDGMKNYMFMKIMALLRLNLAGTMMSLNTLMTYIDDTVQRIDEPNDNVVEPVVDETVSDDSTNDDSTNDVVVNNEPPVVVDNTSSEDMSGELEPVSNPKATQVNIDEIEDPSDIEIDININDAATNNNEDLNNIIGNSELSSLPDEGNVVTPYSSRKKKKKK